MSVSALSPDTDALAALQLLARRDDADINVGEAALLLAARDRPGVSLDRYRDHLEKLADDAAAAYAQSEGSGAAKHEALN